MRAELLPLGPGGVIAVNRVLAIANPDSAPIRRMVRQAREGGVLIDLTRGRQIKAVVVLDTGHIALAAVEPEAIVSRLESWRGGEVSSV